MAYEVVAYDQNSRYPDGSRVPIRTCDHFHRSERTAENCLANLRTVKGEPTLTNAAWYHGTVREIE